MILLPARREYISAIVLDHTEKSLAMTPGDRRHSPGHPDYRVGRFRAGRMQA
jgi:hypothetical protein